MLRRTLWSNEQLSATRDDEGATLPKIRTVTDAATIAASVADLANAGNKNVVVSVAQDMNNIAGIKTAKGNTLTMDLNGKSVWRFLRPGFY